MFMKGYKAVFAVILSVRLNDLPNVLFLAGDIELCIAAHKRSRFISSAS